MYHPANQQAMYSLHSIIEEDFNTSSADPANYARQSMDIKPRRMRSAMTLQQQPATTSPSTSSRPSSSIASSSSRSRAYTSNDLVFDDGPSVLRFPAPPTALPASTSSRPTSSSSSERSGSVRPKVPLRSLTLPTAHQYAPVTHSSPPSASSATSQSPLSASASATNPLMVKPPLRTSSSMTRLTRSSNSSSSGSNVESSASLTSSSQLKSCFEDDGDDDNSSSGSESRYKSLFKRAASALKSPKHQPQGGFARQQQHQQQYQSMHYGGGHAGHKSVSVKNVQVLLPSHNPSTPHGSSSSFSFPKTSSGGEKPLPSVPYHHGHASRTAGDLSPTPSLTSASSCSSSSSATLPYISTSSLIPSHSPSSPEELFDHVDTLSAYFNPSPVSGTFPERQIENPKAPWHHARADSHEIDRYLVPQRTQHKHSRSESLSSIASSTGSSFVQSHSRVSSTTSLEDHQGRPSLKSYASSSALNDEEAARKRMAQRSLLPPSPSPYKRPSTSQSAYLPATTTRAASPSGSISSGHSTIVPSPRSGIESTSSSGSTTPTRITAPQTPKPKSILKSSKSVPSLNNNNGSRPTSPSVQAPPVPTIPNVFVPFSAPRRSPPAPTTTASIPTHQYHHHQYHTQQQQPQQPQMYQRSRAATVVYDRR